MNASDRNVKSISLVRGAYCHSVDLSRNGNPGRDANKEEAFFAFNAVWRGTAVTVEMTANRYRHSGGWSEWRIYSTRAVEGSFGPDGHYIQRGHDVTDTARQRLSAACTPFVTEWLESEAYGPSRRAAFVNAVTREVRQLSDYSVDRVRSTVDYFANEIGEENHARLLAAIDAYVTFVTILNGEAR